MANSPRYSVAYRRKREGKTDYKKRITLIKSGKPRLVIRKSLRNTLAQIISYQPQGDKVHASAATIELKKLGWIYSTSNLPAAYLTGILLATEAKKANVAEAVIDLGRQKYVKGNRLMAVVKGCIDAGLQVEVDKESLPSTDRISGKHIMSYAKLSGRENMEKDMNALKNKIIKG